MAAEREERSGRLEQLMTEVIGGGGGGERRPQGFFEVILGVAGPPPDAADRIVLVNPVTQGMVVLQADPAVVAEILSERGVGGSAGLPPASKASIEAMRTVDGGDGERGQKDECPVCLDGLRAGEGEPAMVREMPCGHRFHDGCIVKWLRMHGSCPVCRFRMPADEDGGSKKGDGEGSGGEDEEGGRRRRGIWVTIVYSRGRGTRSDEISTPSPDEVG